jgi:hypothetical protein
MADDDQAYVAPPPVVIVDQSDDSDKSQDQDSLVTVFAGLNSWNHNDIVHLDRQPSSAVMLSRNSTDASVHYPHERINVTQKTIEAMNIAVKEFERYGIPKDKAVVLAAGMVSNIASESAFDPHCIGDGVQAYGLFQMHSDRREHPLMLARLREMGLTSYREANFEQQIQLQIHEFMQGSESGHREAFLASASAEDAGRNFSELIERPRDRALQAGIRGDNAGTVIASYQSLAGKPELLAAAAAEAPPAVTPPVLEQPKPVVSAKLDADGHPLPDAIAPSAIAPGLITPDASPSRNVLRGSNPPNQRPTVKGEPAVTVAVRSASLRTDSGSVAGAANDKRSPAKPASAKPIDASLTSPSPFSVSHT